MGWEPIRLEQDVLATVGRLVRILEAARYSFGLSKSQMEAVEAGKSLIERIKEFEATKGKPDA